jgi:hypothetical protein
MMRVFVLCFALGVLVFFTQCESSISENVYPLSAVEPEFSQSYVGKAEIVKEIDFLDGNNLPVGRISNIQFDLNNIYLFDSQSGRVHQLDRKTYQYKGEVGSQIKGDPNQLQGIFSFHAFGETLFSGNLSGNYLFKEFDKNGELIQNYPSTSFPFSGMIGSHFHNMIIQDSMVLVSKQMSTNSYKVQRFKLQGDSARYLSEIVPFEDLHTKVDSIQALTAIPRLYLLKSQQNNTAFFTIPSNKYLVNKYEMKTGKLMKSVSLLGIPELRESFEGDVAQSSFFLSVSNDEKDNLYFPVVNIGDNKFIDDQGANESNFILSIIVIDIEKKEYKKYLIETFNSIAPVCIIDRALWCYDFRLSKIILYKLI